MVGGQKRDVVEPRLWLDAVEVDDWIEFILASMGERLLWLLLRWMTGDGLGGGPMELGADVDAAVVADVRQLRSDEKEGVGLTSGLGYGVKPS